MTGPTDTRRVSGPLNDVLSQFGLLTELDGTWTGSGFNLVWLPVRNASPSARLKLNATKEMFVFNALNGAIPNRGARSADLTLFGINYFQLVNDIVTSDPLHFENGLWPIAPDADPAVFYREASIPHGNSLLAQGDAVRVNGRPQFDRADPTPTGPGVTPEHLALLSSAILPLGMPGSTSPNIINDPNLILGGRVKDQSITEMVVLSLSTNQFLNIPFFEQNPTPTRLNAIFWIETVDRADGSGRSFVQLQYTQTIFLNFGNAEWPHISVGTLVKM